MNRDQQELYNEISRTLEGFEFCIEHYNWGSNAFLAKELTEYAARLLTCANKLRENGAD